MRGAERKLRAPDRGQRPRPGHRRRVLRRARSRAVPEVARGCRLRERRRDAATAADVVYSQMSPDKQGKYTTEIIEVSQKLNFFRGLAMAQTYVARKLIQQGKYAEAMQAVIVKITYDKKLNDNFELGSSYSLLGYINALSTNYPKSLEYYLLSKTTAEKLPNNYPNKTLTLVGLNINLASTYSVSGDPKKALGYSLEGLKLLRSKIKEVA